MKKTYGLLAIMVALMLVGCNRFRMKTDHSTQMEQIRIPVDTAQKNDNEHCDSEVDEDPQLILFCHFEKRLIKTHTGSSFQGLLR